MRHICDTERQNNLVYAQRIPIDLGADPLSQDRIVGVFDIFDRTLVTSYATGRSGAWYFP